ncbi:hypothetical protein DAPPUDRAFT_256504 [Daphnia pulex]|uniref:Uncharacterized protein n=1 Tax=Daphnia pulex TaxID=6669 RepID=E9HBI4_DAPPU|nr:hypothetical protein DAPPUDRAFT_256504 [Daphnia pulex]|eukprot:EFX70911.1 hypothetical protein DAPPUDRAFT_256504 [Daphnia pulex]
MSSSKIHVHPSFDYLRAFSSFWNSLQHHMATPKAHDFLSARVLSNPPYSTHG